MIEEILTVLGSLSFSLGFIYLVIKKSKDIYQIHMGHSDELIKGKVVGKKIFLLTGDVHPIVLCNKNNSELIYVFRYFYNEKKYPLGMEIELKISNVSGLLYDKRDLMKDMLLHVFFLIICIFGTLAGLYVLLVLR